MSEFIRELLARRRPGHALEQAFYSDPAVFAADLEAIHYRQWLFAIPACELEKPGSYVTHKVGAYGVVIVRVRQCDPSLPQHLPPSRIGLVHGGQG